MTERRTIERPTLWILSRVGDKFTLARSAYSDEFEYTLDDVAQLIADFQELTAARPPASLEDAR